MLGSCTAAWKSGLRVGSSARRDMAFVAGLSQRNQGTARVRAGHVSVETPTRHSSACPCGNSSLVMKTYITSGGLPGGTPLRSRSMCETLVGLRGALHLCRTAVQSRGGQPPMRPATHPVYVEQVGAHALVDLAGRHGAHLRAFHVERHAGRDEVPAGMRAARRARTRRVAAYRHIGGPAAGVARGGLASRRTAGWPTSRRATGHPAPQGIAKWRARLRVGAPRVHHAAVWAIVAPRQSPRQPTRATRPAP